MAISVRPIRPSDEAAYRNILERTTDEDRYCRFFHVVDHFDPAELHRYVEERSDTIGFIALDDGVPLGSVHAVAIDAVRSHRRHELVVWAIAIVLAGGGIRLVGDDRCGPRRGHRWGMPTSRLPRRGAANTSFRVSVVVAR